MTSSSTSSAPVALARSRSSSRKPGWGGTRPDVGGQRLGVNYVSGHAIFEATHGTAPKYANKDVVNPGSVVLSGEMMFRYLGWNEAADLILKGLNGAIGSKKVTYDFARQMDGATEIKCSDLATTSSPTCDQFQIG